MIPEHSVLVGGFPCQDYSVARSLVNANGIKGKKGVLWWQIYDTLNEKNPPFVLLENVDRLLKSPASQRGRDFGVMLSSLNELGYSCEWRVINAADYGAAQRRRRIYIFAYKNDTIYANSILNNNEVNIIEKDGFFAKVFPIVENIKIHCTDITSLSILEVSDTFKFPFENAGYMTQGRITTCKVVPVYEQPIPIRNVLEKNVDKKYYLGEDLVKWKYLKGAKKINRTSKSGHSYVFSEGAISFPDKLDLPARTMLTSEASVNRSTHVIRDPETNQLRLLTQIEAERLQGFDDNWTNTGMPDKFRYFCMGNALVVSMVTRMADLLEKIIDKEP